MSEKEQLPKLLKSYCPKLIISQRIIFEKIAKQLTTRRNFGFFSIYSTKLDFKNVSQSQTFTTFAGLGKFFILSAVTEEKKYLGE